MRSSRLDLFFGGLGAKYLDSRETNDPQQSSAVQHAGDLHVVSCLRASPASGSIEMPTLQTAFISSRKVGFPIGVNPLLPGQ